MIEAGAGKAFKKKECLKKIKRKGEATRQNIHKKIIKVQEFH